MATTTHKEPAMTTTRCTIDDLATVLEWIGAYEGDDQIRQSMIRGAEFIAREISTRHALSLEQQFKRDIKKQGKMLTPAGAEQLKRLCREKGDALVDKIMREAGNIEVGCLR
jgi:hypothetical protein